MNKEQLLEEIMDHYTDLLFRIAYYYTKDIQVSEDIVQDTFVKFYHSSHYEEQGNIKAYLTKMTINRCKDYLRSWSYRKIIVKKKLTQKHYSHKDLLIQSDETDLLDEAILSLPIKKREAIIYYYLENMSIKEIASLLSVSENTVKSRLRSGKESLRSSLEHIEWEVLLHD
ncbi:sigma-70 family RNA polymerase sigma factor [Sporosarcina sp. Marseille-Q4943]|uniref:sigma-70 family RNA polymerase sigma factor n=1 Tax=Sporosarcina sp. Marseille-Q4943 TaxID=2942204 RepID=UPI00208DC839|nr:sigma-70 family RNA polymerase sigma factor [Sporosarcina sp. Marseille-Q4943]